MAILRTARSRRWLLVSSVILIVSLLGGWVLFKRGTFETNAGRRWVAIEGTLLVVSLIAGWVFFEQGFFTTGVRKWIGVVGMVTAVTGSVGSVTFLWPPFGGVAVQYPTLHLSTSAAEYDRFDVEHPITINLIIAYPPADPTRGSASSVQLFAPGTIFVSKLTRDGVPVKPVSSGGADFIGYRDLQDAGLYQLKGNEWHTIRFDVVPFGNGTWEIEDVSPRGAYSQVLPPLTPGGVQQVIEHPEHEVRAFVLDQPGLYTLRLRYDYSRFGSVQHDVSELQHTAFGDQYVFCGPIVSNEVSFRLR